MNIKRIIFWACFIVVLALIIWGLILSMHKGPNSAGSAGGTPMSISSVDNVRGPENAPVTIIEYADYQCPACAAYHPVVERLLSGSSTTVRFVTRHFPLQQHKNAVAAAQAAEAAGRQGKYWDMAGLLYDNQTSWENLTITQAKDLFVGYAERLQLDIEMYKASADSPDIKTKIENDRTDGIKIGVNSTPSFFINGKSIINPAGYEEFKTLIDTTISGDSD